jgi:hypothetical protein
MLHSVLLVAALLLGRHPLHTTHTDLSESGTGRTALVIRAFTDDLHSAVSHRERATNDSATARYVRATLELIDSDGHAVSLRWVGARAEGEITLLTFDAALRGLAGAQIRQAMHMDLYDDQVNLVQASYGGRRVSLLFLPGDRAKPLP